jgi:hypothetical protein
MRCSAHRQVGNSYAAVQLSHAAVVPTCARRMTVHCCCQGHEEQEVLLGTAWQVSHEARSSGVAPQGLADSCRQQQVV